MINLASPWFSVGALSLASSVAFSAIGAHSKRFQPIEIASQSDDKIAKGVLQQKNDTSKHRLIMWEKANRHQILSALGLVTVGIAKQTIFASRGIMISPWFFLGNQILFSGLLYRRAWTNEEFLNKLIPVGGTCSIIGFILLALGR